MPRIAKRIFYSVAAAVPTVILQIILRRVFEVWGIFNPFSDWLGAWLKMHASPAQVEWTIAALISITGYVVLLYFIWRHFRASPSSEFAAPRTMDGVPSYPDPEIRDGASKNVFSEPPKIVFGNGNEYETKKANGLYKTPHTFSVGIKNANYGMFLSNCKLHVEVNDPKNGHPKSYLLVDSFTLNASEERQVKFVSFDEPASISNYAGNHIRLHVPIVGNFYDIGIGWPWQMPIGAYVFTLRLTCKETAPNEVVCKVWVDDANKLHFERA
jgi:hypothetical protein